MNGKFCPLRSHALLITSKNKVAFVIRYMTSVFVVAKLMRKVIVLTIRTIGRQDRIGLSRPIAKSDAY